MPYNVKDFGALGDGVTNDLPAFEAAIAAMNPLRSLDPANFGTDQIYLGQRLYVPPGVYVLEGELVVDKNIVIEGETSNSFSSAMSSVLKFTTASNGLKFAHLPQRGSGFTPTTPNTDAATASHAPYQNASGTHVCNLRIVSTHVRQGADAAYFHGIVLKARGRIENCLIEGFTGNGIHIANVQNGLNRVWDGARWNPNPGYVALEDPVNPAFGDIALENLDGAGRTVNSNANNFLIMNCRVANCGMHGVYIFGSDSNAGNVINCDASANQGWGFLDASGLGNTYIGCHTQGNALGSYYCHRKYWENGEVKTADTAQSVYIGCYAEVDNITVDLALTCCVIGGLMSSNVQSQCDAFCAPSSLNVSPFSIRDYKLVDADGKVAVSGTPYVEVGLGGANNVSAFLVNTPGATPASHAPVQTTSYTFGYGIGRADAGLTLIPRGRWAWTYGGGAPVQWFSTAADLCAWHQQNSPPTFDPTQEFLDVPDSGFPRGVILGQTASEERRITFAADPTALDYWWRRGDVIFNTAFNPDDDADTNDQKSIQGWRCTAEGRKGSARFKSF
jgi:hypothetical protein